jgi:glutamate-5-semialdehyde dehydrogenase
VTIAPESTISHDARRAARALAPLDATAKNRALEAVARSIERSEHAILAANALDVAAAQGERPAIVDRLTLTPERVRGLAEAVRAVAALPDPAERPIAETTLPNGLEVEKRRVPLGVVLIVYEARPNVTVDAAALCIKSGNACLLRGSRLAVHSNATLLDVVREGLTDAGLPADAVQALPESRERLAQFIADPDAADVVIPRGGEELKHFLLDNSRIPVLAAAGGNNHVYLDASADQAMAVAIAVNAKVQRPGVCNAAETLLVHADRERDLLPAVTDALQAEGVEVLDGEDAWATEFLDMRMAVRVVGSLDEALDHIARYGTGHSEAIVTENAAAAERFTREVDAAAVYVNASTRFTDGGEFGMGAEIGISTSRLHARGPLGLEELTTTKYVVVGTGQIRT